MSVLPPGRISPERGRSTPDDRAAASVESPPAAAAPDEAPARVVEACAAALARLRAQRPLVQCLTNAVVMNDTANALLALGAVPTMSISRDEVADFVARAAAVLINIGTPDPARREAMDRAVEAAAGQRTPWVLDPVLAHISAERGRLARDLMQRGPAVVRGNAEEIAALARLFDADDAVGLAEATGVIVAETGEEDLVTDGHQWVRLANGHPLMARVTGVGCLGSAVVAAFAAVEDSPWRAAVDALLVMGVAGELAGRDCPGPGSFRGRLLDCLYQLDAHRLHATARVRMGHHQAARAGGRPASEANR